MALLVAAVVGFAYLSGPARFAIIAAGVLVEVVEATLMIRWSRRGRSSVGIGALIGRTGVALTELRPHGQVRIAGERWSAVCEAACPAGADVVVTGHDGLELQVRELHG